MTKAALCLKGVAFDSNYVNPSGTHSIDYKNYDYVFKTNVLSPLREKYDSVDIFLSTYNSSENNNILNYFKPYNHCFTDNPGGNNFLAQLNHFGRLNDMIKESNNEYDIIIYMRFDICFYFNILYFNIDLNTLNSIYYHGKTNNVTGCDDNLLIINHTNLDKFIKTIKYMIKRKIHNTHKINIAFKRITKLETNFMGQDEDFDIRPGSQKLEQIKAANQLIKENLEKNVSGEEQKKFIRNNINALRKKYNFA